jgi:hypothetical protein
MFKIQKRENPEKMITGREIANLIFTRFDRRRYPLHGCGPNLSSVYKRGALASLGNHSSARSNTKQTRSRLWATGIHKPLVLQASVKHLHRMRRSRWLSTGVNEINLSNSALNHAAWGILYSPLHLTIWPSGTWAMTGKSWTIQMS